MRRSNYGFDLEKEATIVHEGAPCRCWGLIEQGQLDATQMFNSLMPAMVATGKFRILATDPRLIMQLGLPDTPFLLYTVDANYAAARPANVKAFLAAYREAIEILAEDDAVWLERGKKMKLSRGQSLPCSATRRAKDMMGKFEPKTEADIRKMFAVLLETGRPAMIGIERLPQEFMTLDYQ